MSPYRKDSSPDIVERLASQLEQAATRGDAALAAELGEELARKASEDPSTVERAHEALLYAIASVRAQTGESTDREWTTGGIGILVGAAASLWHVPLLTGLLLLIAVAGWVIRGSSKKLSNYLDRLTQATMKMSGGATAMFTASQKLTERANQLMDFAQDVNARTEKTASAVADENRQSREELKKHAALVKKEADWVKKQAALLKKEQAALDARIRKLKGGPRVRVDQEQAADDLAGQHDEDDQAELDAAEIANDGEERED